MKREARKYYGSLGFELPKLIQKKPAHLNAAQIEAAADKVFNEIKNGEIIRVINIPRRIFKEAETIRYDEYLKNEQILENAKAYIKSLKKELIIVLIGFGVMTAIALYEAIEWLYL